MRVVGYVRESPDPSEGRTGFAQHEELRRHAAGRGLALVAVCQDLRGAPDRNGYRSLLGVVAAGGVDAVLLPGVATLSPDQIVQEIMIWDLMQRGVRVLSTVATEGPLLGGEPGPGATRLLIRDVLTRVGEHARTVGGVRGPEGDDVVIHLLATDADARVPGHHG